MSRGNVTSSHPEGQRRRRRFAVRLLAIIMATLVLGTALVSYLVWRAVFQSCRDDVTGIPAAASDGMPRADYRCLYESGSYDAKCYEVMVEDLGNGLCPAQWNLVSWGLLPPNDEKDPLPGEVLASGGQQPAEISDTLSSVARYAMFDHPAYASYLRGNMAVDVVGHRYRPKACSDTNTDEILARYDKVNMFVSTNHASLQAIAEGSAAKYACVVYRFISETIRYSRTSNLNDIDSVIEAKESGTLGLALTMKALLDAEDIPNYIAYGSFVDSGLPYTWNVAWLDDSWFVFDVPSGCQKIEREYPQGTNERWALDSNIASIQTLMGGCMVRADAYAANAIQDDACSELQLRYEATVANSKQERDADDGKNGKGEPRNLKYSTLLGDAEMRFYNAVSEDLVSGRYINQDDPETWFISPVVISSDEECAQLTEVASCAMYDNPVLSVTNGGGGWSLRYWSKKSDFGYISRYFISSPISNADGNIDMKMESTRNFAHDVFLKAEEESEGDSEKFVYAAYRDISSKCLYSDDVEDTVHHNDAYGALIEGESKCYGVSCAMKMVLDEKGIPNFIAFGSLNGEGHAWNMVYVDGQWYGCDLTAGSLMTKDDYANGTLNREILYSDINEMDTFYTKCMVPADRFYDESSGIIPSDLSKELQESYEE